MVPPTGTSPDPAPHKENAGSWHSETNPNNARMRSAAPSGLGSRRPREPGVPLRSTPGYSVPPLRGCFDLLTCIPCRRRRRLRGCVDLLMRIPCRRRRRLRGCVDRHPWDPVPPSVQGSLHPSPASKVEHSPGETAAPTLQQVWNLFYRRHGTQHPTSWVCHASRRRSNGERDSHCPRAVAPNKLGLLHFARAIGRSMNKALLTQQWHARKT
jgi:hypothetical protein